MRRRARAKETTRLWLVSDVPFIDQLPMTGRDGMGTSKLYEQADVSLDIACNSKQLKEGLPQLTGRPPSSSFDVRSILRPTIAPENTACMGISFTLYVGSAYVFAVAPRTEPPGSSPA